MTKTTIQWLKEYLETKILPCPEGNDYVYGMNVAHTCLIEYMIPYLLEKEKNQIVEAYDRGYKACDLDEALEINKTMFSGERYYEQTYNQDNSFMNNGTWNTFSI
jgi:hypothetical protein